MSNDLPGAADLIVTAWKNYRRHLTTYLEFAAWYLVLAVVQWGVILAARGTDGFWSWADVMLLGSLPVAVAGAFATAALIDNVRRSLDDEAAPVADSFRAAWPRLLPFVAVSLLVFLAFLGGFLLLVVGMLVFLVLYRFSSYAVVVDGTSPLAALGASRRLSSGRFWPVAWRLLAVSAYFGVLANLVGALIFAAAGTALGDAGLFFGSVRDWSAASGVHLLALTVIPTLASVLVLPLMTAADLAFWKSLKSAR
jgi:hypothetical protein